VEPAARALERAGLGPLERVDGRPGVLTVTLNGRSDAALNEGLRALLDASIPLLSYELEGARLSDAFLTMTESEAA
jgi:ABC-2 type transport system ATP-binding protein